MAQASLVSVEDLSPELRDAAIYKRCERDFAYWLEQYGVIEIRDVGVRPMKEHIWPFQYSLARLMQEEARLVILKARQIGVSTLLMHFAYWLIRFSPEQSQHILVISKSKEDASYILEKVPQINNAQPPFIRMDVQTDRTFQFTLSNGNTIECLAAKSSGRSRAATAAFLDEHAYHEGDVKNWAALKPTLEGGGHVFAVSTGNGMANLYYTLYQKAKDLGNKEGFKAVFIPWNAPPHRDEAWLERERAESPTPPELFTQEYPATDSEAFAKTGTCPFDVEWVEAQIKLSDKEPPVKTLHDGRARIWEMPLPEMRYGAGLDCAQGLSTEGNPDQTSLKIGSPQGKIVAAYEVQAKVEPGQVAQELYELLKMYNPFLVVERNSAGAGMIAALQAQGYNNFYRFRKRHVLPGAPLEKMPQIGIQMTPVIKGQMVTGLAAHINAHGLWSRDGSFWRECTTFVQKTTTTWGSQGGAKDDQVIATGWLLWALAHLPRAHARRRKKVRWT